MTLSSLQIRMAGYDDLESLNRLMYQLHEHHHIAQPEHIKSAAEIEEEKSITRYLDNPDCFVYVAVEQGMIVGFITGQFCELISQISKPVPMGTVDELYVIESFRNNNVAGKLIEKLEQMFSDLGVKRMFVEVWNFNQPAIALYKKQGFCHHIHWLCKELG